MVKTIYQMEKKKVFMIMPFQEQFFEVYEMLKMEFSDSFEFSNAGDEGNQQNILKDIVQPIYEADIIIADLTGLNPNVMYELGLAHSFNKKTIMITQNELSGLPFDLKQYRAKDYNTYFKKFAELIEYLKVNLNGAVDNTVIFGNPVKDFLDSEGIKNINWFSDNNSIRLNDDSDKGFIDFMADIESSAQELTANINEITQEMGEMNDGILKSSSEINRVNQKGGSGTAAFVKKETKKAAKHIEIFSSKLKDHNNNISKLWDEIEKNTLGLLENPFSSKSENREGLINYLKSLYDMKCAASVSSVSIGNLMNTMNGIVGIERSMNQAIKFANEDLTTYVNFTERLSSSIDKIIAKSKYVVGELCFENIEMKQDNVQNTN